VPPLPGPLVDALLNRTIVFFDVYLEKQTTESLSTLT